MVVSLQEPMPVWLRIAVKKQAMTYNEAQALHLTLLMADPDEPCSLPEPLWRAASRLSLLQTKAQGPAQ